MKSIFPEHMDEECAAVLSQTIHKQERSNQEYIKLILPIRYQSTTKYLIDEKMLFAKEYGIKLSLKGYWHYYQWMKSYEHRTI
jgi:hypothetical protein